MTTVMRSALRTVAWPIGALSLVLLGVGVPVDSLLVLLGLVVVQVAPGVIWIATVQSSEHSSVVWSVGAVLGVLVSSLCEMLMFEVTGQRMGLFLPLVLAVFALLRSTRVRQDVFRLFEIPTLSHNVVAPFVLGLLYLSRDFRWFFLAFVASAIALISGHSSPRWRPWLWSTAISLSTLSWFLKPNYWWFITDDLQVFESISYHFTKYGMFDELGPLGSLGPQYHVLTYQWSGILSLWSGADPYIVLNRALPVLTAFLVSWLAWAFIDRNTHASFSLKFLAALAYPLVINYSFVSPSYVVGVAVLLAAFHFWSSASLVPNLHRFVISFLFAGSLALIKSSNIPVVGLGLGALLLFSLRHDSPRKTSSFVNLLGAYSAIFLYGLTFLLNERTSRQIESFRLFGYAKQVVPDINSLSDRPTRSLAAFIATLGIFVLPFLAVVAMFGRRHTQSAAFVFAAASLPFALLIAIIAGNQANGYFISSGLNLVQLCGVLMAARVIHEEIATRHSSYIKWVLLLALLVSFPLLRLSMWMNGGSSGEIWLRVIEVSLVVPLVIVALVLFVMFKTGCQRRVVSSLMAAAFLVTLAREASVIQILEKGPELSSAESDQAIGGSLERDIITRIDTGLAPDAVLATNRFCGGECVGDAWFERDVVLLGDDFNLPSTPSAFGGNNFRLSAEARRRVLLEGPRWLIVNGYPVSAARQRMAASLTFAETASVTSRESLKKLGVTHFVLHLPSRASKTELSTYGAVVMRNDDYIVFSL